MDENALRWLMNTEEGRQVVFGILELAGAYRTDFSADENTNLYLAGRRSIGTDLLQEIRRLEREGTVNEDGLALEYRMLREAKERAERSKREAEEKDIFE